MKKDPNTCIRIDRDEEQIIRCKNQLIERNEEIVFISKTLALAGNEVRLKILCLIKREERLCVCDLGEILEMKVPAISQHLRKLKDAQLLVSYREGTVIYYQISKQMEPTLDQLINLISTPISV